MPWLPLLRLSPGQILAHRQRRRRQWLINNDPVQLSPIAAFANLKICSTAEESAILDKCIMGLLKKDPEMLAGILANAMWLKGKARDHFIYEVVLAGMQIELANIFPSRTFGESPTAIQPTVDVATGSTNHNEPIIDGDSHNLLEKCRLWFEAWLNKMPKSHGIETLLNLRDDPRKERRIATHSNTNCEMHDELWTRWCLGLPDFDIALGGIRNCIIDCVLSEQNVNRLETKEQTKKLYFEAKARSVSTTPKDKEEEEALVYDKLDGLAPFFLPKNYAYSQALFRHFTFPGQKNGKILVIRRLQSEFCEKITGDKIGKNAKNVQKQTTRKWALPAESWSLVSATCGEYGSCAMYVEISVYNVLTSCFAHKWNQDAREIVIMPLDRALFVTIESKFDEPNYQKNIVYPAMIEQYGANSPFVAQVRDEVTNPYHNYAKMEDRYRVNDDSSEDVEEEDVVEKDEEQNFLPCLNDGNFGE
jgi:hypothetical protein